MKCVSEQVLVQFCAPTLAGMKTGSIFTVANEHMDALCGELREMNRVFRRKGLRIMPLRVSKKSAILYLYRPKKLEADLMDPCARCLLEGEGYQVDSAANCVTQLMERMRENANFPHEIGLFIGYPVEDVKGFMNQEECKCVGCWKVYGNVVQAQKTFARYHRCREVYTSHHLRGSSIDKLTVAC